MMLSLWGILTFSESRGGDSAGAMGWCSCGACRGGVQQAQLWRLLAGPSSGALAPAFTWPAAALPRAALTQHPACQLLCSPPQSS